MGHKMLTPAQLHVFDELLAIGGPRPVAPASLADDLRTRISEGVATALASWPEPSLWFNKSSLTVVRNCEGQVLADAQQGRTSGLHPATAAGLVVHRAIQLDYTHPDLLPEQAVKAAVGGCRQEQAFADFWDQSDESSQSDLITTAVNRVCGFLDTFPPLEMSWVPRFEDSLMAKVGSLTLAARPDLVLGRPRGDGRQTMFLADFKSGALHDHHQDEALFYALVATLRTGCPPFRSCVLSLASGEWTDPDVSPERLHSIADKVVAAVVARVEVLTEQRSPVLRTGTPCRWCPAKATCPAHAASQEEPGGTVVEMEGSPFGDGNGTTPVVVATKPSTDTGPPTGPPTGPTSEPADVAPPAGVSGGNNPWEIV